MIQELGRSLADHLPERLPVTMPGVALFQQQDKYVVRRIDPAWLKCSLYHLEP